MSRGVDTQKFHGRLTLALKILFAVGLVLTIGMVSTASAESGGGDVSASRKSRTKIKLTLGTSAVHMKGVDPNWRLRQ